MYKILLKSLFIPIIGFILLIMTSTTQAENLPSGKLVASSFHNCAIVKGGEVRCWGTGKYGELGNGKTSNTALPQQVSGLKNVKQLLAGDHWTCALSNGEVYCWGQTSGAVFTPEAKKQLKKCKAYNFDPEPCATLPLKVANLKQIVKLGGGGSQAFALDAQGKAWGWHMKGAQLSVTQLPEMDDFISVSNTSGEISPAANALNDRLDQAWISGCFLNAGHQVQCWGSAYLIGKRQPICQIPEAVCEHNFDGQTLALVGQDAPGFCQKQDQVQHEYCKLMKWVCNNNICTYVPAQDISQATHFQCLIEKAPQTYRFDVFYPELVNPDPQAPVNCRQAKTEELTQMPVEGIGKVKHLSVSWQYNAYAILEDQSVWYWGDNEFLWELSSIPRQPNAGGNLKPVTIPELKGALQIKEDRHHGCAVFSNGQVKCWGENTSGILGKTATGLYSSKPVLIAALPAAKEIQLGWVHSCAHLKDGRVACWGNNEEGQLGKAASKPIATPVIVPGLIVP